MLPKIDITAWYLIYLISTNIKMKCGACRKTFNSRWSRSLFLHAGYDRANRSVQTFFTHIQPRIQICINSRRLKLISHEILVFRIMNPSFPIQLRATYLYLWLRNSHLTLDWNPQHLRDEFRVLTVNTDLRSTVLFSLTSSKSSRPSLSRNARTCVPVYRWDRARRRELIDKRIAEAKR